jgi:hypothetical protein
MFRTICTLTVICGLGLAAAPAAIAHERAYDHYPTRQHHVRMHRDKHMPRWLRHDRGFRHWYRHSSVRRDRHLAWWQLFEIYRWERKRTYRYDHDRHYYHDRRHGKRKGRYRYDD